MLSDRGSQFKGRTIVGFFTPGDAKQRSFTLPDGWQFKSCIHGMQSVAREPHSMLCGVTR